MGPKGAALPLLLAPHSTALSVSAARGPPSGALSAAAEKHVRAASKRQASTWSWPSAACTSQASPWAPDAAHCCTPCSSAPTASLSGRCAASVSRAKATSWAARVEAGRVPRRRPAERHPQTEASCIADGVRPGHIAFWRRRRNSRKRPHKSANSHKAMPPRRRTAAASSQGQRDDSPQEAPVARVETRARGKPQRCEALSSCRVYAHAHAPPFLPHPGHASCALCSPAWSAAWPCPWACRHRRQTCALPSPPCCPASSLPPSRRGWSPTSSWRCGTAAGGTPCGWRCAAR